MASSDSRAQSGTRKRLLEEHRRVSGLTLDLRRTRDLDLLLTQVVELQERLREHFAREEEAGGFFESVRESAPRHVGRVNELAEEHRRFMGDIEGLAQAIRACLSGPVADVFAASAALSRRLRRHEADEHDLMMQVVLTDLGTGD